MSELRLFFAARPDATVSRYLEAAAGALPCDAGARRVPPGNYHLTLAFIGGVDATRLAEVRRIGALLRAAVVTVRMDAYEYWPKPEVIVTAARSIAAPLQQLWETLHAGLAPQGWALQPKRLRPHVTLARKVSQVPQLPSISAFDWTIREISLMSSDTSGTESAYTVVDTWSLLDKPENT